MNHIQAIKQSVDFIEKNIEKDINILDVANYVYYSPYHFSRIFTKNTGITLGAYINNRKIAAASSQLLHSDKKLIDISLLAGYTSYEAFSREIKAKLGISPYYFRRQKTMYYLVNRSLLDDVILEHLKNNLTCIPSQIAIEDIKVLGYLVTTSLQNNQLASLWEEFHILKNELFGNFRDSVNCYSICESKNTALSKDGDALFSQFLSFEKRDYGRVLPGRFVNQTIKGGKYMVFEHNTTYHSLDLTYRYIWHIWLQSSQIDFDNTRKSFELYAEKNSPIYIYIPIK